MLTKVKTVARILFGLLFIAAGIAHFLIPQSYIRIVPPILPFKAALVAISGVAEIALGTLLMIPRTMKIAAWGLVALLIAVYPANIYMALNADQFRDIAPSNIF